MARVLVVAAHPDDETLGCGGTIAAATFDADIESVHVLIFADGGTGIRGTSPDRCWRSGDEIQVEADGVYGSPGWRNAHKACSILGVESVKVLDFPDTRFETRPILGFAHQIEDALHRLEPEIVYTHHGGDLNMDHRWVHQAVVAACRPKPGSPVKQVLFFETPSSTEWAQGAFQPFIPTVFQPLQANDWAMKEQALQIAYSMEMRASGHPRSLEAIKALAVWRGAACGAPMAEAFMAGRITRP